MKKAIAKVSTRPKSGKRKSGGKQGVEPNQCVFWKRPEGMGQGSLSDLFEVLETYFDNSHWQRQLLKCRECGQLYFYEWLEIMDYDRGADPVYRTYVAVASADDTSAFLDLSPADLNKVAPCLRVDWPSDTNEPKVFWVKGENLFPPKSAKRKGRD